MKEFLTVLFGFIAGVAGGMGLGGGTFLIPLLQFLDYSQTSIQAMNLLSFIPMAVVALFMHFKNKLVVVNGVPWIIIPAVAFSILGAILANGAEPRTLQICFGVFITVVGIFETVKSIIEIKKAKKKKEQELKYEELKNEEAQL